ncbi:MAG TPA: PDC sensor domain-containing protein [Terriglobales bacterium]|nr:PDC sensor domain-containing protein [Terriglobales bacterium]
MTNPKLRTACTMLVWAGALSVVARAADRNFAQHLVEATLAKHPELAGVELSSTPPGTSQCQTIASTDPHDLGDKCDNDELTAIKTDKPFAENEVEKGQHVWDITSPLHDSSGKLVGTVGMDVKPRPGQTKPVVLRLTAAIVQEMEQRIPSKASLFAAAP